MAKIVYQNVTADGASDRVAEKKKLLDAKLAEYNENAKAITEGLTIAEEAKIGRTYKKAADK